MLCAIVNSLAISHGVKERRMKDFVNVVPSHLNRNESDNN